MIVGMSEQERLGVAEVLYEAADIIAERGLAQGSYHDPKTHAVCAVGAIHEASSREGLGYWYPKPGKFRVPGEVAKRARNARQWMESWLIAQLELEWVRNLYSWSDGHEQREVVKGLRDAAETARKTVRT